MSPLTRAMILAAGRGERMQPLTDRRAKPTLPFFGRPLLGRVIAGLAGQGIQSFAVNAHHQAASVRGALTRETPPWARVELFVEEQLMGNGGALAAPASFLAEEEFFLLHNGDTLVQTPVAELGAAAGEEKRLGALLVRRGRTPGYGGVIVNDGLVVGRFAADDADPVGTPATFLGVSVLRSEVLNRVRKDGPSSLFSDLLMPLLDEGWSLPVIFHDGPWIEFTTTAQYLDHVVRALTEARDRGEIQLPGGSPELHRTTEHIASLAPGADLAPGPGVTGAIALERGARIRSGATVTDAILLERAEVDPGAVLRRVIVSEKVHVRAGESFENGVLTAGPGETHVFRAF